MVPNYYFRAPPFDISPESSTGPKLGSILPSLKKLTGPLNQHDHVSIPPSLKSVNVPKSNFEEVTGKNISGSAGVYANAAAFPGTVASATGDLIYEFATNKKQTYSCKLVEKNEFEPDEDYVTQAIAASQGVQQFIADSFLGNKKVFMITGLMIATGFSSTESNSGEQGPSLMVGFNAASLGVPIEAGPQLSLAFGHSREVSHGPSSAKIIFAYRAIKITPKRNGGFDIKPIAGGIYDLGEGDGQEEVPEWKIEAMNEQDRLKELPNSTLIAIEYVGDGITS